MVELLAEATHLTRREQVEVLTQVSLSPPQPQPTPSSPLRTAAQLAASRLLHCRFVSAIFHLHCMPPLPHGRLSSVIHAEVSRLCACCRSLRDAQRVPGKPTLCLAARTCSAALCRAEYLRCSSRSSEAREQFKVLRGVDIHSGCSCERGRREFTLLLAPAAGRPGGAPGGAGGGVRGRRRAVAGRVAALPHPRAGAQSSNMPRSPRVCLES